MRLTLAGLPEGGRAVICGLISVGDIRQRLQDIGLIPGTRVECVRKSPLGDPAAYLIRGAVIAIRGRDAEGILIAE